MKSLQKDYLIKAPITKVWSALIDPELIDDWGAGQAKMSDQVGFEFELWDGDIRGKILEVVPNKKLVEEWMAGDWDEPSIVTFVLSEQKDETKLHLEHTNIPEIEFVGVDEGWDNYFLIPLKEYVEQIL